MGVLPEPVEALLETALVSELTVVSPSGRPVTHPLIPLYDGELIYLTSSILFSKKLEHIKANPKVSLAITDPTAVGPGQIARATIQGDAEVDDSDLHAGWERVLPLWRKKEPAIDFFLGKRVALTALLRARGDRDPAAEGVPVGGRADRPAAPGLQRVTGTRVKPTPELIRGLKERFAHAVVAYVDSDGYPMSVATEFEVDEQSGTVVLRAVAGEEQPPQGEQVNVVFSHIRPQPGIGYDERRYVSLWGQLRQTETGLELSPERVQGWDEQEMSFFEYSERGVGQAHRYLEQVSEETGREVRPKLSFGWLFLRATRLPFLTATFVPVLLGIAVAAWTNGFNWWLALLTVIGGACIHLGLNVANDVFDTTSGADAANVNPTQFSGGSRVVHYGLLTLRDITLLSAGFYAVGIGIGVYLAATRGWDLLWLGIAGALLSVFYTAPPLKLVHRGLGEIDVFLGFGPIMVLGAYFVQAQEYDLEPLLVSIPVGILIALVLYVNEVPDRPADASADKRTLPVRFSKDTIVNGYAAAVAVTFALIVVFAVAGWIVRPAIIAVAAAPLALPVYRALKSFYDQPYALMPAMGKNIQLHLATGVLLILGYVIALIADGVLDDPPLFLT